VPRGWWRITGGSQPDVRAPFQFGIRATSPARTIIDCAPALAATRQLTRLVNGALVSPFLSRGQLADICNRLVTYPGRRWLAGFVEAADGPTRSEFEDRFLGFCAGSGCLARW
jgi:hypothetical protein